MQPEIEVTVSAADGDLHRVTVADNGGGIPPGVVGRILDFATLTSDKALYRSPSRGAQGNALKTIIGIPHALGVTDPVIVEARGVRHVIAVGLDAAGNAAVRHDTADSPRTAGTAVTVPLPGDLALDAARWVRGYALVNPHAAFTVTEHGHDAESEEPDSYKPTAGDGWRKPLPGDPTSAWWYDAATFTRLAASLAALGDDRPIGQFIAEFRGPVSHRQAKADRRGRPRCPPRQRPGAARRSCRAAHGDARGQLAAERESPWPHPRRALRRAAQRDLRHRTALVQARRNRPRRRAWHIEVTVAETISHRRPRSTPAITRCPSVIRSAAFRCGPPTCRLTAPRRSWATAMPRPATPTVTAARPSSRHLRRPGIHPTRARPSSTSRPRSPTPSPRSCGRRARNCTGNDGSLSGHGAGMMPPPNENAAPPGARR